MAPVKTPFGPRKNAIREAKKKCQKPAPHLSISGVTQNLIGIIDFIAGGRVALLCLAFWLLRRILKNALTKLKKTTSATLAGAFRFQLQRPPAKKKKTKIVSHLKRLTIFNLIKKTYNGINKNVMVELIK